MKKKISIVSVFAILAFGSFAFSQSVRKTQGYNVLNPAIEQKINALIARMTLAEKLGQLQQLDGEANGKFRPEQVELAKNGLLGSTLNVRGAEMTNELQRAALSSRLKIPMLFGFDVIHGYRTIFPVPLGESASWNLSTIEQTAAAAAAEARAAGVHWTFAPMVDIARDPRWGRIIEGAGEDTYLGSKIAAARVRGFQGNDFSTNDRVMATAKHWVGYGAAEAGRDYNTTNITRRQLYETYFPPFKAALDSGVGSFMTAFNDLDGVPATANPFVLKDVLRNEWGFKGLVVSDYTSVMELYFHGLAKDEPGAAMYALNAGTDMEMVSRFYNKYGAELLAKKLVSTKTIDDAVRNVLRVKFRLGLFEHPFADSSREKAVVFNPKYRELAKKAAEESFVLLKNQSETLPISKNIKTLAVIGDLANNKREMNGNWTGDGQPEDPITVVDALKAKFPNMKITFVKGCDAYCTNEEGFAEAVEAAKSAEFTIIVAGESVEMSAEAESRSNIDLPGKQTKLIREIHKSGKPYAVVLMNGRPLTINWIAENSPAILETWFPGTMAGPAIADTLFGDSNPSGKLPVTFPRSVGQIPIYYNHKSTGRPILDSNKYTSKYTDVSNSPLFPFGFGLSYTKFRLSNLRLSKLRILPSENVEVSVNIKNYGKRAGDEVLQLYIHDIAASVTRPVRELRGFKKIKLQPDEEKTEKFTLTPDDLKFYGRDMKRIIEPGEFEVIVGTSSDNGMQSIFEVIDPKAPNAVYTENFGDIPPAPASPQAIGKVSDEDSKLLEDISKRSFMFLWDHTNPNNGLVLDRVNSDGTVKPMSHRSHNIATIAGSGFALTSNCIAAERNWLPREQLIARTKSTLEFFANKAFNKNGWFYHWLNFETGERAWNSEVSSIDTALLLGGVFSVKQCFKDDAEIVSLANKITDRIDYSWMRGNNQLVLSMGWKPESGFLNENWDEYSEELIIYLLGIGAKQNGLPRNSWYGWERRWNEFGGYRYLAGSPPLFLHQYSHTWVDFRYRREPHSPFVNYYDNSVAATRAHQKYFADVLSKKFPTYSEKMWGLSASDSEKGYLAWGAPSDNERIDGTVVPYAVAGSLMFAPDIAMPALREMYDKYGAKVYGKYGFVDAFNPANGWVDTDILAIDQGMTLLGIENFRTGNVWYWFMQNEEPRRAMQIIGLK
ncbi:MAG: glycoside hydrolase family 3 N-terminal domain-containing protein [Pyrinomonadaceae bacterium]